MHGTPSSSLLTGQACSFACNRACSVIGGGRGSLGSYGRALHVPKQHSCGMQAMPQIACTPITDMPHNAVAEA